MYMPAVVLTEEKIAVGTFAERAQRAPIEPSAPGFIVHTGLPAFGLLLPVRHLIGVLSDHCTACKPSDSIRRFIPIFLTFAFWASSGYSKAGNELYAILN